jgi:hypothetical protein
VQAFTSGLFRLVPEPTPVDHDEDDLVDFLVYRPVPRTRPWQLLRIHGGFRVVGQPPSEPELERALRAAGARKGARIEIGDEELELA